jgi:ATP-dependent Lon protease
VIVPEKNRRDIRELDKEITKGMRFVYARTMKDVLQTALERMPESAAADQTQKQED